MRIGIIGAGNVGGTLGSRWAQAGHQVIFSSRDPQSDQMKQVLAKAGPNAKAGTVAEAASGSEVILVATPWNATHGALREAGSLEGKVVIDATNPLKEDLSGLVVGTTTSGAEMVAQWSPGAKVVKAFNTVGSGVMANSTFGGDRPVLFVCGDDKQAKQVVRDLAAELGFDAEDAGPITQARLLEPFALLWISLAVEYGFGVDIAFKLLHR